MKKYLFTILAPVVGAFLSYMAFEPYFSKRYTWLAMLIAFVVFLTLGAVIDYFHEKDRQLKRDEKERRKRNW